MLADGFEAATLNVQPFVLLVEFVIVSTFHSLISFLALNECVLDKAFKIK